ncbi:MAG: patatin-like phospholipase family protein [Verrucomicrobia bacterium]|nr:patatin-like phospholipase family protein [Verrucomicrobiota bacterium]
MFAHARAAIKEHPGCEVFAARVTSVLNLVVRPLTGKWHRALQEGRLNGRDGADEFRGELQGVQEQLRAFATELHEMAYGKPRQDDLMPPVMTEADLDEALAPLEFGFTLEDWGSTANDASSPVRAAAIRQSERDAVTARREHHDIRTPADTNAIGLALSGGGIRSATFSLGVVQVLADKGFLKEIDFLSTVSGGVTPGPS